MRLTKNSFLLSDVIYISTTTSFFHFCISNCIFLLFKAHSVSFTHLSYPFQAMIFFLFCFQMFHCCKFLAWLLLLKKILKNFKSFEYLNYLNGPSAHSITGIHIHSKKCMNEKFPTKSRITCQNTRQYSKFNQNEQSVNLKWT